MDTNNAPIKINEGTVPALFLQIHKENPKLELKVQSYFISTTGRNRGLTIRTSHCEFSMPIEHKMTPSDFMNIVIVCYKQSLEVEAKRLEEKAVYLRSIANVSKSI